MDMDTLSIRTIWVWDRHLGLYIFRRIPISLATLLLSLGGENGFRLLLLIPSVIQADLLHLRFKVGNKILFQSALTIAVPTESVEEVPPRSGVSISPSVSRFWTAFSTSSAAELSPRCLNIIAPVST